MGLLIVVLVTAACVSDAAGGMGLLRRISRFDQPRLARIAADRADRRDDFDAFLVGRGLRLEISSRPAGGTGFVPLRIRWVVERTYGWLA